MALQHQSREPTRMRTKRRAEHRSLLQSRRDEMVGGREQGALCVLFTIQSINTPNRNHGSFGGRGDRPRAGLRASPLVWLGGCRHTASG